MSEETKSSDTKKSQGISRRDLLKGIAITAGVVAVGAVAGVNPIGTANAAGACPGMTPKATLQYQDHPNGKDQCSTCAHFIAPHCCTVVAGPVAADGWCMAFAPKA